MGKRLKTSKQGREVTLELLLKLVEIKRPCAAPCSTGCCLECTELVMCFRCWRKGYLKENCLCSKGGNSPALWCWTAAMTISTKLKLGKRWLDRIEQRPEASFRESV